MMEECASFLKSSLKVSMLRGSWGIIMVLMKWSLKIDKTKSLIILAAA